MSSEGHAERSSVAAEVAPVEESGSQEVAIRVGGVSKSYHIYEKPQDWLKQSILARLRGLFGAPHAALYNEFWALRDVAFEVYKGETVGIIGRNGSGKSTLLQIICGILSPTTGAVTASGRIAALLELGSGFNTEFTGRENVFMSGAILGLQREEIEARFDEIAEFAGIGEFMEQPVKTYSSGMFVRLAFSVNIMSRPEIMVVDEALAVGDMAFQAKCMTALRRIQESGATVLFVSHDIGSVKSLCSRAIYLDRGKVVSIGAAGAVAERYVRDMREEMNEENRKAQAKGPLTVALRSEKAATAGSPSGFLESPEFAARVAQFRYGSGEARITYAELLDENGEPLVSVTFDQEIQIRIHFVSHERKSVAPAYYVLDDKKIFVLGAGPRQAAASLVAATEGERFVATYRTRLPLQEGDYSIQLQITEPVVPDMAATFLDVIEDAIVFRMERRQGGRLWARVLVPNTLRVDSFGATDRRDAH